PRTLNSATRLVLVLRQVRAELAPRVAGKFRALLGEVGAFPARQFIALEIQGQGLDLDRATADAALAGRMVPALGVERVGPRGGAEQAGDLLLAQPRTQLVHRFLLHQVALVDGLLVQDTAAGNGERKGGDQQQATKAGHAGEGDGEWPDDTLPAPPAAACSTRPPRPNPAAPWRDAGVPMRGCGNRK